MRIQIFSNSTVTAVQANLTFITNIDYVMAGRLRLKNKKRFIKEKKKMSTTSTCLLILLNGASKFCVMWNIGKQSGRFENWNKGNKGMKFFSWDQVRLLSSEPRLSSHIWMASTVSQYISKSLMRTWSRTRRAHTFAFARAIPNFESEDLSARGNRGSANKVSYIGKNGHRQGHDSLRSLGVAFPLVRRDRCPLLEEGTPGAP